MPIHWNGKNNHFRFSLFSLFHFSRKSLKVKKVKSESDYFSRSNVWAQVTALTFDGYAQLIGDVSDLRDRVRYIVVVLEEVEDAEAEHVEGDADVAVVVEPVEDVCAQVFTRGVLFFYCLEHIDFQFSSLPVFVNVLDNLQRNLGLLTSNQGRHGYNSWFQWLKYSRPAKIRIYNTFALKGFITGRPLEILSYPVNMIII